MVFSARTWPRRVLPRAERLGGQGMARQDAAAARLDPDAGAEPETSRSPRSSAAPDDKRFVQVLMLVMRRHAARHARHYWPIYAAAERLGLPIGVHAGSTYQQPADAGRLGLPTTSRTTSAQAHGVPDPVDQPDRRGRVRQVSDAENGDAGIRLHLAAGLSVAAAQVLARRADGDAVGRPRAAGDCAQQHVASRCSRSMRRRTRQS